MKKRFIQLIGLAILSLNLFAQETTGLKYGEPVNLDGTITYAEWQDADSIEIPAPSSQAIKVYFKHDGTNFLAAFVLHNIEVNEYKIPEILFDTYNDKAETWQPDDWWFHVSAQDCEAVGTYDVWDDCAIVQPDWQGVPNFGFGTAPPIDTIELLIPWEKLSLQTGDTIGFAFDFWVSDDLRLYWPDDAEIESPSTWGTVIISEGPTGQIYQQKGQRNIIRVQPNPFHEFTKIEYSVAKRSRAKVTITNSSGKGITTLINETQKAGKYAIVWDGTDNAGKAVPSGIYYCRIREGNKTQSIKMLRVK
nr:T9SS type A sorting domain-containing protein [Bacteroidota bacterium]